MKLIISFVFVMLMASLTFGHCGVCGSGHVHSVGAESVYTTSCCSAKADGNGSCCEKKKEKKETSYEMKVVRKADKALVLPIETQKKVDDITENYEKKLAKLNKSYCKSIEKELSYEEFVSFQSIHKQCK